MLTHHYTKENHDGDVGLSLIDRFTNALLLYMENLASYSTETLGGMVG